MFYAEHFFCLYKGLNYKLFYAEHFYLYILTDYQLFYAEHLFIVVVLYIFRTKNIKNCST